MSDLEKRFPIYSKVIKLYPLAYRKRFGDEVMQTTADLLDEVPSLPGRLAIWAHLAVDIPLTIAKQQLHYAGGIIHTETPRYIKRNSLFSGILLIPFFTALLANGLDKVINGQTLYRSWLWRMPFLGLWVLWLPEIAFLIFITSYLVYVCSPSAKRVGSWHGRLADRKHLWPIMVPGVLALGVLILVAFHDSTQCLAHTPSYIIGHSTQTLRCVVPPARLMRLAI
jgi:hypothetical protein